ncbi:MAG: DUF3710 domain-containing protein [Actinomycetales bacterium]
MSLFRRKNTEPVEVEPDEETKARLAAEQAEDDAEEQAALRAQTAERRRVRQGPMDAAEVVDVEGGIDLGALRLNPRAGMELRMEVVPEDQSVRSVTAVLGASQVQLQVFAAPRTAGVWDEIRAELVQEISKQGGTADEREGTFGEEILARLPVRTPDGRTGHQVTRFVGVDGPRWFLRAVISGKAAVEAAEAEPVEEVIKGCVIHRDDQAMPPRQLLALRLPEGARPREAAAPEGEAGGAQEKAPLSPPERGPEITEIR